MLLTGSPKLGAGCNINAAELEYLSNHKVLLYPPLSTDQRRKKQRYGSPSGAQSFIRSWRILAGDEQGLASIFCYPARFLTGQIPPRSSSADIQDLMKDCKVSRPARKERGTSETAYKILRSTRKFGSISSIAASLAEPIFTHIERLPILDIRRIMPGQRIDF